MMIGEWHVDASCSSVPFGAGPKTSHSLFDRLPLDTASKTSVKDSSSALEYVLFVS